ncbi:MAG: 50S ribosomal protein L33 [Nitrospirae bacterium]|nr:50S ribosomal protein L33 [Nitrospirota bacterium]MBI5194922.1 50S ribosomal protein L33 [Nitrospirota bacterium]
MRDIILLQCSECKNKNYSTTKNKTNTPDKLNMKKYCRNCRKHTAHKETKA